MHMSVDTFMHVSGYIYTLFMHACKGCIMGIFFAKNGARTNRIHIYKVVFHRTFKLYSSTRTEISKS